MGSVISMTTAVPFCYSGQEVEKFVLAANIPAQHHTLAVLPGSAASMI